MSDDLVSSAVTFLQDPKVADAPLAKRVAFLESKGLSPDQVQDALQRAQHEPTALSSQTQAQQRQNTTSDVSGYRPAPPPATYSSYALQQQLPPPLPKRDWRDWFIMAIVSGGFSWAIYFLAKHYVVPLISPPKQSQLESDKETVTAQFDQVQEMLSILQKDTEQIREKGDERNEKLEVAMAEVDGVVKDMQQKTTRRENDIRRLALEMDQMREMIPKAIEAIKTAQNDSLADLGGELRSLKTLLQNRLKTTGSNPPPPPSSASATSPHGAANTASNGHKSAPAPGPGPVSTTTTTATPAATTGQSTPAKPSANDVLGRFSSHGGSGIPDWQKSVPGTTTTTGTGTESSHVAGTSAATASNVQASSESNA